MITELIIRNPQQFVQQWLINEKVLALRASLNKSLVPTTLVRIPPHLQKRVDAASQQFDSELSQIVGKCAYLNWLELADTPEPIEGHSDWSPTDFMATATCLRADWGTAARKKARRLERENRRKYRAGQGVLS